jgi:hypothetical protein
MFSLQWKEKERHTGDPNYPVRRGAAIRFNHNHWTSLNTKFNILKFIIIKLELFISDRTDQNKNTPPKFFFFFAQGDVVSCDGTVGRIHQDLAM